MEQNLFTEIKITLKESLLGFEKEIKHLDGRYIKISSDEVVQPFEVKVIHGEGMPVHESYQKGDLHVKFIVVLPYKITQP